MAEEKNMRNEEELEEPVTEAAEEDAEAVEAEEDTDTVEAEEDADADSGDEAAGETEAGDDPPGEGESSGKGRESGRAERKAAKKQAKADKKAEAYKEQIGLLEDKVKRQLAEFENFRNRTEREKQAMFEIGARSVIEKILPVVDNFERGLATVPEEQKGDPFVEGMSRVYKQLLTELDNMGVKPIEALGHEFDPDFHNAVMQVESEEYESGIVAQELQKGYTYRDSVVRHSMVAVVQ